jgi:hypothetical protein
MIAQLDLGAMIITEVWVILRVVIVSVLYQVHRRDYTCFLPWAPIDITEVGVSVRIGPESLSLMSTADTHQ